MREPWSRGYVKICGVTTLENARGVIDAGVDAIGINLAQSVRHVTSARAHEILRGTEGTALRTLVFAENPDEEVVRATSELAPDVVQVHGALSDALLAALRDTPVRIVKALNIESEEFDTFSDSSVDAVLIDGPRPGSGSAHSWERLALRHFAVPVIAAGGLAPRTVAAVIAETGAWGVDCASAVESAPGVKDLAMVRDFVAQARSAWSEVEAT